MERMKQIAKYGTLTPKQSEAFQKWNEVAFKDGALSHKLKELMAIAAAATTGCDFCLDLHGKAAKRLGVTDKEVAEALMVATASKAGSSFAHGANALNVFDEYEDDDYFKRSYMPKMMELKEGAPEDAQAFFGFTMSAFAEGELTVKEKELIATVVALITSCPYCIEQHVTNAKKAGATREEVSEAVFIAAALNAGSAFTQAVIPLKQFD